MDGLIGLPVWLLAFLATLFTYCMTACGAAFVFLSKKFGARTLCAMQGAAAGIMIAASFFSLLLPAKESLEEAGGPAALVLTLGFFSGGAFIVLSDIVLRRMRSFREAQARGGALTFFAMTLHNIPEGFAVGVAFGTMTGDVAAFLAAAMLAVGIGIQNFPQGLCVSMAMRAQGMTARRAFFYGQFSGIVEIAAGVLGALAVGLIHTLLPWALAFSAGAMIAVSCSELIPSCVAEGKTFAVWGVTAGFAVMMLLDVLLG